MVGLILLCICFVIFLIYCILDQPSQNNNNIDIQTSSIKQKYTQQKYTHWTTGSLTVTDENGTTHTPGKIYKLTIEDAKRVRAGEVLLNDVGVEISRHEALTMDTETGQSFFAST